MSYVKIQNGLPLRPPQENPEIKLRQASKMYEEHFLREMTKAMRSTVDHAELTKPSMAEEIYTGQLDQRYVENWADTGGVGLADLIYNQIHERFFNRAVGPRPQGPVQIKPGTTLKVNDGQNESLPVINPKTSLPQNEVSFIYEWKDDGRPESRDVTAPFDGKLLQSFSTQAGRQLVKLAHDSGLVSTMSYLGTGTDLKPGATIQAGERVGGLGLNANGFTWQLGKVST